MSVCIFFSRLLIFYSEIKFLIFLGLSRTMQLLILLLSLIGTVYTANKLAPFDPSAFSVLNTGGQLVQTSQGINFPLLVTSPSTISLPYRDDSGYSSAQNFTFTEAQTVVVTFKHMLSALPGKTLTPKRRLFFFPCDKIN